MSDNRFDQTARLVARDDADGFFAWLIDGFATALRFVRWLDTRTTPLPGEPDQTADRVALVRERDDVAPPWLILLEFQAEPDPKMPGRLLSELGRLWIDHRFDNTPNSRYQLAAAVVNLTGTSRSVPASQSYVMPVPVPLGLTLNVRECYLAEESAATTLDRMAAGEVALCVLPLVPLMKGGGESATMERWKEVAGREADAQRRGTLKVLTEVMAELAGCEGPWRVALEGWDVRESKVLAGYKAEIKAEVVAEVRAQVRAEGLAEGRAEGRAEALRQSLLSVLTKRFSPLPPDLASRLSTVKDADALQRLFDRALDAQRLEDLTF